MLGTRHQSEGKKDEKSKRGGEGQMTVTRSVVKTGKLKKKPPRVDYSDTRESLVSVDIGQ